jgi:steroid 5-alpha reductase family enzyme
MTAIFFVALAVFVYVSLGFITALFLKRNDIADVMWGPGIFLVSLVSFVVSGGGEILLLGLVFLWACRIAFHIGARFFSKKEEDFRYETWRKTWKYFYVRSYLQVFLLQGFLMMLVASGFVTLAVHNVLSTTVFLCVGVGVALCALLFETVADMQLKEFLRQNRGGIMRAGVWKYSRHPNYFGEVTFWWGLCIAGVSPQSSLMVNLLLLVSPLTITFLILYVSGIPMLERKYAGNQEFEEYKATTNAFFPWFPKSNSN